MATLSHSELHRLLRRPIHDARNCLNYVALEASLMEEELAGTPQVQPLQRMQRELGRLEHILQTISSRLTVPQPREVSLAEIYTEWRGRLRIPAELVQWQTADLECAILTDPLLFVPLLVEMSHEFQRHQSGPFQFNIRAQAELIVFELCPIPSALDGIVEGWKLLVSLLGGTWTDAPDHLEIQFPRISGK
jgi:signal transduction histidine kinase